MLDLGFCPPFALTFDQRSQLITWKTGRFALSLDDFTMIRSYWLPFPRFTRFSNSVGSSDVPLLLLNYLNIEKPLRVRLRILGPTDVMSFI